MGKIVKKGRTPQKNKRVAALAPKVVSKQSSPIAESAVDVVSVINVGKQCAHLDNAVDFVKLSEKIGSMEPVRCQHCRVSASDRRGGKGKADKKQKPATKAIWFCLECGCYACGGVGFPTTAQSHSFHHFKSSRHSLVMQIENPHLCWCFSCNSLIPVLKSEENGKQKVPLFEIMKLIKGGPVEGGTKDVEDVWFGSGSIISETRSESTTSDSIDAISGGFMVRGLLNLGNTCFFNSVMQNLMAMDKLRNYFLKLDGSARPLSLALQKLFVETSQNTASKNALNPKSFFGILCSKAPQFRGYDQHDSHELLRCLLDGLCTEELGLRTQNSCKENGESLAPSTSVEAIFGGQVSSTVCCMLCKHSSTVYEPFLDLSLAVPTKKHPSKKAQPVPPAKKTKLPPKRAGRYKPKKDVYPVPHQSVSISSEVNYSSQQLQSGTPDPECEAASEDFSWLDFVSPNKVSVDNGSASHSLSALDSDPRQTSEFNGSARLDYLEKGTFADDYEVTSQNNGILAIEDSIGEDLQKRILTENSSSSSSQIYLPSLEPSHELSSSYVNPWEDEVPMQVHGSEVLLLPCKGVSSGENIKDEVQERVLMENSSSSSGQVCLPSVEPMHEISSSVNPCEDEAPMQVHSSEVLLLPYKGVSTEENIQDEVLLLPYKEVSTGEKINVGDASSITSHGLDFSDLDGFCDIFNEPETSGTGNNSLSDKVAENGVLARTSSGSADDVDNTNHVVSIESCLAFFTKPELLSDEHAWHCENCSKNLQREQRKLVRNKGSNSSVSKTKGGGNSSHTDHLGSDNGLNPLQIVNVDKNIKDDVDFNASSEILLLPNGNESCNTSCSQASSSYQTCDSCSVNGSDNNVYNTDEIQQSDPKILVNECESEESDGEMDSNSMKLKRDATKRFLIDKAPPILTIHLNRFSQDGRGHLRKLNGHVSFQDTFDLIPFMDPRYKQMDRYDYRLIGVVEHSGSMNRGHYVAYVRGGENTKGKDGSLVWYYVSDVHVRQVSLKEVLSCEAYILFYEKI